MLRKKIVFLFMISFFASSTTFVGKEDSEKVEVSEMKTGSVECTIGWGLGTAASSYVVLVGLGGTVFSAFWGELFRVCLGDSGKSFAKSIFDPITTNSFLLGSVGLGLAGFCGYKTYKNWPRKLKQRETENQSLEGEFKKSKENSGQEQELSDL